MSDTEGEIRTPDPGDVVTVHVLDHREQPIPFSSTDEGNGARARCTEVTDRGFWLEIEGTQYFLDEERERLCKRADGLLAPVSKRVEVSPVWYPDR